MSGFLFAILASLFASTSSLVTAKTIRYQKESSGYFTFYFLVSLLSTLMINFLSFEKISFSAPLCLIGSLAGFLLISSMVLVGKGVQKGPSGLTFAFLNSGAVAPPIILAFIFSQPFGFSLSLNNLIGMSLVVLGLFWAASGQKGSTASRKWVVYAISAFIIQAFILTIFQWRALLIRDDLPSHKCLPFSCSPHEDFWFMPAMFLVACVIQGFFFYKDQKRAPSRAEVLGGTFGGIANGLSTVLLLLATNHATEFEKPMLFPFFASLVIILCNVLDRVIQKEKVNWLALSLLAGGIFVGTFFA